MLVDQPEAMIGHFDVAGDNLEALSGFYRALFGWTVSPRGPGYAQIKTPGLSGALVESSTASLTLGVIVNDLDDSLAKAVAEGGDVVMPVTDNGWVRKAQVRDPAGNILTLIQK